VLAMSSVEGEKREKAGKAGLGRKRGAGVRRLCSVGHWPGTRPTPVRLWGAHLSSPGTGQSRPRAHARWLLAAGLPQAACRVACISAHLCMAECLQVGTPCGRRGRSDDMMTVCRPLYAVWMEAAGHFTSAIYSHRARLEVSQGGACKRQGMSWEITMVWSSN
jgi:hypothetical protein